MTITIAVREATTDDALNELFAASWPGHRPRSFAGILERSLLWVTAARRDRLVGFVNVATDGGIHAIVLDTTVHPDERRNGLGVRLVRAAAVEAKARGARWLHADYVPHLETFYARCGFRPTKAGLVDLTKPF
ncbi:GNAT family N-acetyltransferase [Fodinicola acaciae]|uniref:GNAT family N-acetyltransferase n=1 Tax=Fodinicola acaciae TaxID=2681555 RepID=UPI0013D49C2B|nr:GNAT family N-acetyltransferase [Fodinicola acaciae]